MQCIPQDRAAGSKPLYRKPNRFRTSYHGGSKQIHTDAAVVQQKPVRTEKPLSNSEQGDEECNLASATATVATHRRSIATTLFLADGRHADSIDDKPHCTQTQPLPLVNSKHRCKQAELSQMHCLTKPVKASDPETWQGACGCPTCTLPRGRAWRRHRMIAPSGSKALQALPTIAGRAAKNGPKPDF